MKPPAPRIRTVDPRTPFSQRLAAAFSYPVRGAALPTALALALAHYVALLPFVLGIVASLFVWGATWRYAAECLLHTAHGFADPPDVQASEASPAGWMLTSVHVVAALLCLAAPYYSPYALPLLLVVLALVLPSIDMSIAFDGNLLLALNPQNWARIISAFGATYLVPVAINLGFGMLVVTASALTAHLPRLIALPVFAFAFTYLAVLGFHLMGAMIHQRHERFGLALEADRLLAASGQNKDQQLLAQVNELASADPQAAIAVLVPRLQDREAPAELHQAYRDLLRRQNLREGLLVHGQIRIAALMATGESRKALGMVQDCAGIDPDFLPDDPGNAGALAELAVRTGMRRMGLKLCRGWLTTWPRDPRAPAIALLAAPLMEGDGQAIEAAVLLGRTAAAWPDHPQHDELASRIAQLQGKDRA